MCECVWCGTGLLHTRCTHAWHCAVCECLYIIMRRCICIYIPIHSLVYALIQLCVCAYVGNVNLFTYMNACAYVSGVGFTLAARVRGTAHNVSASLPLLFLYMYIHCFYVIYRYVSLYIYTYTYIHIHTYILI